MKISRIVSDIALLEGGYATLEAIGRRLHRPINDSLIWALERSVDRGEIERVLVGGRYVYMPTIAG